jgi:uncharacterized membrane protein
VSILFIALFYAIAYISFEVAFNAIARLLGWYSTVLEDGSPKLSLEGSSSLWMGIFGMLVGVILFFIKLLPFMNGWFIILYMFISCIIITGVELGVGLLLNIKLKLKIWDYTNEPFNYKGQISLFRSCGWFMLGFIVFWLNTWIMSVIK